MLLAIYGGYRLWRRTDALGEPALVTPAMNVHRLLSPSLAVRWERLVHGNAPPAGPRPKLIALTFDDGPYPVDTPLLLDVLADLHVRATFFLIGRDAEQYPELVRRITERGGEIADHTLTHPNLAGLDDRAVRAEIDGGAAMLARFTRDPAIYTMMRPPHGRYREATLRVAQAAGYDVVLWNDDPGDWRSVPAADLQAHVLAHATAPEILLLHSGRLATVGMLPAVVERYRASGYRFVTVGELLRTVSSDQLNHPRKNRLDADTGAFRGTIERGILLDTSGPLSRKVSQREQYGAKRSPARRDRSDRRGDRGPRRLFLSEQERPGLSRPSRYGYGGRLVDHAIAGRAAESRRNVGEFGAAAKRRRRV